MSSIEDRVCEKIQERSKIGKAKYGVTMERTDLDVLDWLKHLQEEVMDAAVYLEKLMEEVKGLYDIDTDICTRCGNFNCTC